MIYPNRPALPRLQRKILPIAAALLATGFAQAVRADTFDLGRWPNPAAVNEMRGELVSYPSHSRFTLREVGGSDEEDPTTPARELTYARQFAAMGVAALVVDAFGARRDRATGFVERLLEVTETMVLADAYAGLQFLDARPEIDGVRVALIGFSYGGIAATLGAFEQTAETLSPDGPHFAAHISYYGPCIARFDDPRATGAPVLMLAGSEDAIVDPMRCNQVLDDLRAGGAETEFVIYQNAYHQWDGSFRGPRPIGRNLADCRFKVGNDGVVRDSFTFLQMTGPISCRLILAACVDSDGYLIDRDDNVRAKSNRAVGDFLTRAFTR